MGKFDLSDVQVHGQDILSFVDAMGSFSSFAERVLEDLRVGTRDATGKYQIVSGTWYPLQDKINILEAVRDRLGPLVLRRVGERIPANAYFPPAINSVHKAISSIDIAYHMNHRKSGRVMYDARTGILTEGIGHYGYEAVAGKNVIISVCDNPNLSEYDEGILLTMARRFERSARVELDAGQPTRRSGGRSCTFIVSW